MLNLVTTEGFRALAKFVLMMWGTKNYINDINPDMTLSSRLKYILGIVENIVL